MAIREQKAFWIENDIILNMQKGLWVGQSILNLEGFTLFDTPLALTNLSLSNFKENSSIITIDSYEIKSVLVVDSNANKNRMAFPTMINALISFMKNFGFTISFFAKETSFLHLRWKQGIKIIKQYSVALKALEVVVPYLPAKILYFMNSKTQAFLCSCAEATSFD